MNNNPCQNLMLELCWPTHKLIIIYMAGVCGKKWLMNLISSDVIEPQALRFTLYIKPGGVPDNLCVFPADES